MNGVLRKAVRLGLDPVTAITLCTLNPARHYGLDGLGAVAPGKIADIVVLEDLDGFSVEMVFKNGRLAAQDGALIPGVPGAPGLQPGTALGLTPPASPSRGGRLRGLPP